MPGFFKGFGAAGSLGTKERTPAQYVGSIPVAWIVACNPFLHIWLLICVWERLLVGGGSVHGCHFSGFLALLLTCNAPECKILACR